VEFWDNLGEQKQRGKREDEKLMGISYRFQLSIYFCHD
jgi:hypothetical protein